MVQEHYGVEEYMVCADTLPEAYHLALRQLAAETEIYPCDDWNTTQKEISMTMIVRKPLAEPMISRLFIGGPRELEQYRQEMLYGILDFEVDKGNWAYTYHRRMEEQIPFVISELKRNPSSRRAVIVIRDWKADSASDDPACLQHIQYFIRNGALSSKVLFRSNDACKATFMNAFALIMLQKQIADELGVKMGTYVHRASSFHCYEKDLGMLEGYARRIEDAEDEYDICFDYADDWEELMQMYQPEIAKMVEELKNR